jgi:hypothetical protein
VYVLLTLVIVVNLLWDGYVGADQTGADSMTA